MALKPIGNNILAGTSLAVAQIQSPGYVPGVKGWIIRQDGSAEFNSGTFRGPVIISGPGGGEFVYSASPALGDLIASIVNANGTDSKGNNTYAGICSYAASGGATPTLVAQLLSAALNLGAPGSIIGTGGASPASVSSGIQAGQLSLTSGGNSGTDAAAGLTLESTSFSGATVPLLTTTNFLQILTGGAPPAAASPALYSSANGTMGATSVNGFAGTLPLVQSDSGTNTNANSGNALRITAIYTIPANDLSVGTKYVIEVPFNATMEGNTLELGLSIDGSTSFTVNNTLSGAIVGAGAGVNGVIRVGLMCTTAGATGKITAWTDGSVNQTSAATTFANSGGLAGNIATGVTLDTTAQHTIRVNSLWGASNASQTVSGRTSTCTRTGP